MAATAKATAIQPLWSLEPSCCSLFSALYRQKIPG
jgi:hypothetical protein